ncbi:MAG TPA: aspartate-semialdehyde dehydrogenase [Actinomycetota bacterium]|nr:aspartate-semialdehyde dehydrogenase [Actinomycetota bacterium]
MRVAILGATGAVGREMLRTLEERSFPLDALVLLSSPRSAGRRLPFRGDDVVVRAVEDDSFEGVDLALFSAGATASQEYAPRAVDDGAVVVDNSSAFRMDPGVPLVIPEVNAEALSAHRGIVANPNCTAITAIMAVAPLHRAAGLRSLVVSSYQSVSGAGHKGVAELLEQVDKLRGDEEDLARPDPAVLPVGEVFGKTIAFNVIPRGGSFEPDGWTTEETKLVTETRKILELPELAVAATVVRVPVVVGHSVSAVATFDRAMTPDEARGVFARAPGMLVVDDPASDTFPTPLAAAGRDEVLVGRIRSTQGIANAVQLFAASDNLRKGAALNAVQIAELVAAR